MFLMANNLETGNCNMYQSDLKWIYIHPNVQIFLISYKIGLIFAVNRKILTENSAENFRRRNDSSSSAENFRTKIFGIKFFGDENLRT